MGWREPRGHEGPRAPAKKRSDKRGWSERWEAQGGERDAVEAEAHTCKVRRTASAGQRALTLYSATAGPLRPPITFIAAHTTPLPGLSHAGREERLSAAPSLNAGEDERPHRPTCRF